MVEECLLYWNRAKPQLVLGRFNNFRGQIGKNFAKITKNWKIIVVLKFEDEMVYNFADGQFIIECKR